MSEPYPHGIMLTQRRIARRVKHQSLRLLTLAAPFIWTAVTMAQSAPQPSARKVPPTWIGYLVIFGLLVLVLLVSMMPSKRTHQD
jgi:hypothetical protein